MGRFYKFYIFAFLGQAKIQIFLKNPISHFKLYSNACHQVHFQKNLINRYNENFKC